MQVLRGILGIAVILAICLALSRNRRAINLRLVASGVGLQVLLGLLVFKTEAGAALFRALADFVTRVLEFSYAGTGFVFGSLGQKGAPSCLAFQALPIVIYFSALMAVLYHFGVLQVVVFAMARILGKLLRVSGAESMVVAANVFVGMTEAPLVVRPYIEAMTRSELMALMTGGFATIAGTVMGIYMTFVGPAYAAFILAASVMAAPAAFVTSKIILPETEESSTGSSFRLRFDRPARNVLEAISGGVRDGLNLALNIAAMLVAFYALIALLNWPLQAWLGTTVQGILGWILAPFAWCLGVDWGEAPRLGSLLGTKVVVNEWVGYQELQGLIQTNAISDRTVKIATFALCGFANFGSIGVTLGGVGQLAPSRRGDLAQMALPAMVAGALSSCMTAAIAGMLL
jgi:CNT family concentrative nucleoside transporter